MTGIEIVQPGTFEGRHIVFQILQNTEQGVVVLYAQAETTEQRDRWLAALRQQMVLCGMRPQPTYHPGVHEGGRWSCCGDTQAARAGCQATTPFTTVAEESE